MESLLFISIGSNLVLFALILYERNKRIAEREKFSKYLNDLDRENARLKKAQLA